MAKFEHCKIKASLKHLESSSTMEDSNIVFHFELPKDGLALYSAEISDGKPVLRYKASPRVPTIQEEDVATIFRLASENKRPEFFYLHFPFTHPVYQSRQFMHYSPAWLRQTKIGKLLADIDWNMKCLHVGAKTNEEKTNFFSWSRSSNLQGLATRLDFPKVHSTGSIIMSCEYAKVQKMSNEIRFPEEPKIRITDESSPLYSKYITEIYPSIAYHDEPKFLKMQEIIKLILAVEWLYKEKGVRVNREWMMEHTSKSTDMNASAQPVKKPPHEMIPPLPKVFKCPSSDVTVRTREAEMYKALRNSGVEYRYGYLNFGGAEMVMFTEDGIEYLRQKCLKVSIKQYLFGNVLLDKQWLYIPLPKEIQTPSEIMEKLLELLPTERKKITSTTEDFSDDSGLKMKLTRSLQPSLSLGSLELTTVISATVDNYNKLFVSEDPNEPIPWLCEDIVPDVKSWEELISKTDPIPCVWQDPFSGLGEPIAAGGVTTRNFREDPVCTVYTDVVSREVAEISGIYERSGDSLGVRGIDITAQGMYAYISYHIL